MLHSVIQKIMEQLDQHVLVDYEKALWLSNSLLSCRVRFDSAFDENQKSGPECSVRSQIPHRKEWGPGRVIPEGLMVKISPGRNP